MLLLKGLLILLLLRGRQAKKANAARTPGC
jgi:hypothetical protein